MDELKTAKRSFSRVGFMLLVFLLVGSLFQGIVTAIVNNLAPQLMQTSYGFWLLSYVPLYLAVPLALLCVRNVPAERPEDHSLSFGKWLMFLAICIFFTYAGNIVGNIINSIISSLAGSSLESMNPLANVATQGGLFWRTLILAVVAPIMEELMFRRMALDRMRIFGEKTAVLVSALLFALFHANFAQLFYAFLLGLLFGYVYIRTGRLRYSIALHMIINFIGSVLSVELLRLSGLGDDMDFSALMSGGLNAGAVGLVIYGLVIVVLFVAGLVLFIMNRKNIHWEPAAQELLPGTRARTAIVNPGILVMIISCVILMISVTVGLSTGMV